MNHKILIVSDAWHPQINGVVRTLSRMKVELEKQGHRVKVVGPNQFLNLPCPSYPEIRLSMTHGLDILKIFEKYRPTHVHIATEGPLGTTFRALCKILKIKFTSSFHTKFPEYAKSRVMLPLKISYAFLRKFHSAAEHTLVPTESVKEELLKRGFTNLKVWGRGVDLDQFHPFYKNQLDLPRPIHLYVGRVAIEKNIKEFLDLKLKGSRVVVGGGPQLEELKEKYPEVHFLGPKEGEELSALYSSADLFVFPSKTDTFGLVVLEALASGLPVAAFNVAGPRDILRGSKVDTLSDCLRESVEKAYSLNSASCRNFAAKFEWSKCAERFKSLLCYSSDLQKKVLSIEGLNQEFSTACII